MEKDVTRSEWQVSGELWTYHIAARSFVHHMVRNLVGTFLEVGQGRRKAEDFDPYLLKVIEDRPTDPAVRIALARARAGRGDKTAAIEALARAIEIDPEDPNSRGELGRQLIASGQDAEALKAYADLLDALERGSLSLQQEAKA